MTWIAGYWHKWWDRRQGEINYGPMGGAVALNLIKAETAQLAESHLKCHSCTCAVFGSSPHWLTQPAISSSAGPTAKLYDN
jgi:hypothetical protein